MHFNVVLTQVAAYPGESIKLVIISYDEQNFVTSDTIEILESVQSNVSMVIEVVFKNCYYVVSFIYVIF